VDDVFTAVHNYNMMNKANKTIQLTAVPGVYSPSWLTDGGILKSCDPLFDGTKSSLPDCGMVTFSSYPEQRNALNPPNDPLIVPMPLPWSYSVPLLLGPVSGRPCNQVWKGPGASLGRYGWPDVCRTNLPETTWIKYGKY
jgi:hypothetical protein